MKLHPLNLSLVLATALVAASGAQAQSLLQIYQEAKGHDATYAAAKAQSEATAAKAAQAKAALLPTLGMSFSQTKNEVDRPSGIALADYTNKSAGLSLTQPIFSASNWATYKQGEQSLQLSATQLLVAEQELILRVSQAYFDVLTTAEALTSVQAQKKAVSEQLASAKRNFEVGTATIVDTREAEASYDRVISLELSAENDLRTKKLALDQLAGKTNLQPAPLNLKSALTAPQPQDVEAWVKQALENNTTLQQLRVAHEVAKLDTDKAKAGHLPTLELSAKYGETRCSGTAGTLCSPNDAKSLGLTLNIPLFAGFAVQNRVKETVSLQEKTRAELEAAERTVDQNTRSAYFGLLTGLSQVKALVASETSSQSVVDATKLGYQVGVKTNLDVLNSQTQLFQTKRDLAKARYDVLQGQLKLRQAAGVLKAEDVQSINDLLQK
ncbi:TolC family outer membrane protein [Limnohabitans sp. T6-20]|uniref:TolC family outer membrane protein n=1 Tax=Limnohabitans sp. T6-20 TaxID=1100725 RepID=UPI000D3C54F4|nr:TolC family outer membrane protein [Limnohabitans sp. T6-20]PUE09979.1 channel protein TolC [Limnohabitans sp. T6-20]